MINSRSLVEVGVAMVLKDRFSQEAGRISNSFRTMMNDMNAWSRGIQMSTSNAFEFGKKIIGGMASAYQYSAGVYDQVFLASKMSGATAAQEARLMKVAKEVNEITPLTAADIASGERYLAMAGNNVEQIEKMIGPASKLASIFSMTIGEKGGVADLMTNIMQTFNLPAKEATKVADQLATAVTSSNISLIDLAQAFQYSGAEFRNAKLSMGDAAAAIGVLGNQGIQASAAGTALANMMRYLTLSVTGQKKAGASVLKSLGIDPQSLVDSHGNLLRLDKIITLLGDKLRGKKGIDISSALFNIFGVRGTRAASALLQDYWTGANKLTELMNKVNSSNGIVDTLTKERLEKPMGVIQKLKSTFENLVVTVGGNLHKLFKPIANIASGILRIVNSIAETWAGGFLTRVIATATIVGTLRVGFLFIKNTIRMIRTYMQAASTGSQTMALGMASTNVQATILEGHLARISAMMMKITAMNMTSGAYMGLPGGGMIGKTRKGRTIARDASGRFISMAGLAGAMSGSTIKTAAAKTVGKQVAKRGALSIGSKVLGLGSKFLGPWGWALSIGIPLLIDGIGLLTGSVDKNTEALRDDDKPELSAQERNQQAFIQAVRSAIKDGFKDSKINISIDGDTSGQFTPGTEQDFTGVMYGIN